MGKQTNLPVVWVFWVIVPKNGAPFLSSVNWRRSVCIRQWVAVQNAVMKRSLTWRQWRQRGWRCVPVEVPE